MAAEEVTQGRVPRHPPEADVLSYDVDTYGMPRNVMLNGQRLHGVQGIEVRNTDKDYAEVRIELGGTYVVVNPKESSAQDS